MIAGAVALAGFTSVPSAKLPAPSPEEKAATAAKAEKDAAGKAKAAKELSGAHDRAAENYRKNKHKSATPSTGADHAKSRAPDSSGRR